MLKKHTISIAALASCFLVVGAWAQLVENKFLQVFNDNNAVVTALGNTVSLAPPAFSAVDTGAERPILIAQTTTPSLPPTTAVVEAPETASPGFSADMSTEALQAEIAAQVAQGKDLNTVLAAARNAGVPDVSFVRAAVQVGVAVATITTTLINATADPTAALRTLGTAFIGNQTALESVVAAAATVSTVTLSPAAVVASIEAGCGSTCVTAPVVIAQTTTVTAVPLPAPVATTPQGSGGNTPLSPS